MRKLRTKVTQRMAVRSYEWGAVEHARALRGLRLPSCGPSHKPLHLPGPARPPVGQKPRRRAPTKGTESLRDGPAFPKPSSMPGPPHPIPRLSCRISLAWWCRRGRKAAARRWSGEATSGGPTADPHKHFRRPRNPPFCASALRALRMRTCRPPRFVRL